MSYFKCRDCWRVYTQDQLLNGPYDSCKCGSRAFRSSNNKVVRRLLTDFSYTVIAWIRERLNHGKEC